MQPCFTAIFARPLGPGSYEPHTGTVGLIVHAPLGLEDRCDVARCKEVRLAVWAVENADLPLTRIPGWCEGVLAFRIESLPRRFCCGMKMHHIPGAQRAS